MKNLESDIEDIFTQDEQYIEDTNDDFMQSLERDIEGAFMQDEQFNEDTDDEFMQNLEKDIEDAFMQDLKGGVADGDIPKLEPHSPGAKRPQYPWSNPAVWPLKETARLKALKVMHIDKTWEGISMYMLGRSASSCRCKYLRLFKDPVCVEDEWSPENDALLRRLGNSGETFEIASKKNYPDERRPVASLAISFF
jgi:hypothetical protein